MTLDPYDLFDVRSRLSEEERAVQDAVARFTDEKVIPVIGEAFDQGRFPKELVPEVAALGLLDTTRGRGGGMRLMRPAEQINLGAVVRATEGDFELVEFQPFGFAFRDLLDGDRGLMGIGGERLEIVQRVLEGDEA